MHSLKVFITLLCIIGIPLFVFWPQIQKWRLGRKRTFLLGPLPGVTGIGSILMVVDDHSEERWSEALLENAVLIHNGCPSGKKLSLMAIITGDFRPRIVCAGCNACIPIGHFKKAGALHNFLSKKRKCPSCSQPLFPASIQNQLECTNHDACAIACMGDRFIEENGVLKVWRRSTL